MEALNILLTIAAFATAFFWVGIVTVLEYRWTM